MSIRRRITRWFNRRTFRYKYVCPNGCVFISSYDGGYCRKCGAKLVKTDVSDNLCPNCGWPRLSEYCGKCGYKFQTKGGDE